MCIQFCITSLLQLFDSRSSIICFIVYYTIFRYIFYSNTTILKQIHFFFNISFGWVDHYIVKLHYKNKWTTSASLLAVMIFLKSGKSYD